MGPLSQWRVMFIYWGRRGLTRFTLELSRAAAADARIAPVISVSRQNESYEAFTELQQTLLPMDTFSTNVGALTQVWRIPFIRRRIISCLAREGTQAVITLMPHVWMPLIAPAIRRAGVRYVSIVHDVDPHPGDPTRLVQRWMHRDVPCADLVLTLSEAVAGRLAATGLVPRSRLLTLFHPDLFTEPHARARPRTPAPGEPFRILFLGRIMRYKGLSLLLDAIDLLRDENVRVHVGVFGEGSLYALSDRLRRMDAEIVNRWLTADEIAEVVARFHAVALSHTQASQSGVAAVAFGSGLPVVANPVGGLIEQVVDGHTGVLARSADAPAFAEAIKRLALDPTLYQAICRNIAATRDARSMERFVADLVTHAIYAGT